MGDHGWHLGEKAHWSKNVPWEESARTPLIIYDPRAKANGQTCNQVVSLLDVYPTLIELCNLPPNKKLQGQSIVPLLYNPNENLNRIAITSKGTGTHSMRNANFRYIKYADGFEELYNHQTDPMEWHNIASNPESQSIIAQFQNELKAKIKPSEQ